MRAATVGPIRPSVQAGPLSAAPIWELKPSNCPRRARTFRDNGIGLGSEFNHRIPPHAVFYPSCFLFHWLLLHSLTFEARNGKPNFVSGTMETVLVPIPPTETTQPLSGFSITLPIEGERM
jgi:hypothetical protein